MRIGVSHLPRDFDNTAGEAALANDMELSAMLRYEAHRSLGKLTVLARQYVRRIKFCVRCLQGFVALRLRAIFATSGS